MVLLLDHETEMEQSDQFSCCELLVHPTSLAAADDGEEITKIQLPPVLLLVLLFSHSVMVGPFSFPPVGDEDLPVLCDCLCYSCIGSQRNYHLDDEGISVEHLGL